MWQVYYLFDATTNELLYIGRSDRPKTRQRAFHKLHRILTEMGPTQRFKSFEEASQAEVAAIKKHRPPFNRMIVSAKGAFGYRHSDEAKKVIGLKAKKPKSEATKQLMRKPKSQEHREAMKKPKSPEHKQKLQIALEKARMSRKSQAYKLKGN